MRAVIQRSSEASVTIGGQVRGSIGQGFVVLLGVEDADTAEDIEWLCGKIARLRVFNDDNGLMNCSLAEVGGGVTLFRDGEELAMVELLMSGCTTVADHHYVFSGALVNAIDCQVETAQRLGVRAALEMQPAPTPFALANRFWSHAGKMSRRTLYLGRTA